MATLILIHGSWHGKWCWELVIPLLEKQGHRVIAPDLPGMGKDTTPVEGITLEDWAQSIAQLVSEQPDKVILVGHSRGGIVISQVAEYVPEKIQSLVYLSGFLVPNRKTLMEILLQNPQIANKPLDLVFSEDMMTSRVREDDIEPTFYNNTPKHLVQRAILNMGHELMAMYNIPLSLSEGKFGQVKRYYIECLQDNAIPLSLQRSMVAALACKQVISLNTDHSPFYSMPNKLVSELVQISSM